MVENIFWLWRNRSDDFSRHSCWLIVARRDYWSWSRADLRFQRYLFGFVQYRLSAKKLNKTNTMLSKDWFSIRKRWLTNSERKPTKQVLPSHFSQEPFVTNGHDRWARIGTQEVMRRSVYSLSPQRQNGYWNTSCMFKDYIDWRCWMILNCTSKGVDWVLLVRTAR